MVPLAFCHLRARLGFRAQTLSHTKFIVHENEDLSCELVRGQGCDFEKVSDLGKASDLLRSWKGLRFWEGQRFWKFSDFKKISNLRRAHDFEKVSDLEKATYLSLSATVR